MAAEVVDGGTAARRELHDDVQTRLRAQRDRVAPRLRAAFDELVGRHGFVTDDADAFFHPLAQPLVTFPRWVAAACGGLDEDLVRDLVESTVMGYLYVRVHDDVMDEGLTVGSSAGAADVAASFLLADAFLERHVALLVAHVTSGRFWALHASVAGRYAEAMLLERQVSRASVPCTAEDFDRVLDRSLPLVLPGAAILDRADRWDDVATLTTFVQRVVRAGQIVDDIADVELDVAAGNHTWVGRQLGSTTDPAGLRVALATGGLRRLVRAALDDLAAARALAGSLGMHLAIPWIDARADDIVAFERHALTSLLFD